MANENKNNNLGLNTQKLFDDISVKEKSIVADEKQTNDNLEILANNKKKILSIQFYESDLLKLKEHFRLKGYDSISQPIRKIVFDYMKSNNLL